MKTFLERIALCTVLIGCTLCSSSMVVARPNEVSDDTGPPCPPYGYCKGTLFPRIVRVDERDIECDQAVKPRDKCCLPQDQHMVCYSIALSGQFFNYDSTTDFTALCAAMLESVGKTPGRHSTIIVADIGGRLNFENGRVDFLDPTEMGDQHIHHIACSYED